MKTVMIIDDHLNVLEDVKSILKNEFNVIAVDCNRKALKMLEKTNKDLGLILIDSNIPDTEIPAFFSMNPDIDKKVDTTKTTDFLIKPFTSRQLVEFVKDKIH